MHWQAGRFSFVAESHEKGPLYCQAEIHWDGFSCLETRQTKKINPKRRLNGIRFFSQIYPDFLFLLSLSLLMEVSTVNHQRKIPVSDKMAHRWVVLLTKAKQHFQGNFSWNGVWGRSCTNISSSNAASSPLPPVVSPHSPSCERREPHLGNWKNLLVWCGSVSSPNSLDNCSDSPAGTRQGMRWAAEGRKKTV